MSIPAISAYPLHAAAQHTHNRVDWTPDPARAVLLIHDMQQYFIDFYGEQSDTISTLINHIQQLKQAAKAAGIPVVYTAQPGAQSAQQRALLTDFWGPGLADDPALTRIIPALSPAEDDQVLTKWRYSAFQRSSLQADMAAMQRDQLIIVGVYAHIGCLQTAADAFMNDIQAFLVADGVADFSLDEHRMALNYVGGRCGQVISTAEVLEALNSDEQEMFMPPSCQAELIEQIAALLEIDADEITETDSLVDFGLDSVRMMSLLGSWQQHGLELSFMELAATPCIQYWWPLIANKTQRGAA